MSKRTAIEWIDEILARVYKFDDKPHQLFSALRALAQQCASSPIQPECIRLMDVAYNGVSAHDVARWEEQAALDSLPVVARDAVDGVIFCPFCGGTDLRLFVARWKSHSLEEPNNDAELSEHQCKSGKCQGRSFWA